jgi:cytochrome b561
MSTNDERYTRTAIALHWLIALLIFVAFPLGLYMSDLKLSPTKLQLFSYHKWIGVTVFVLALARIIWRVTHRPPALPDSIPKLQQIASHIVHGFLYALLFAVPISGWLMSSAKGFKTVWFGIIPLPDLIEKDKELGKLLEFVHQSLNYFLLLLVVLHVAALIKHRFIDHDDVLTRMLPGGKHA